MIIPADRFKLSDAGTQAWWIPKPSVDIETIDDLLDLDRLCDTCGDLPVCDHGYKITHARDIKCGTEKPCPDCIDGRHTFEIEVEEVWRSCDADDGMDPDHECDECLDEPPTTSTLTVSVVPGMALTLPAAPVVLLNVKGLR